MQAFTVKKEPPMTFNDIQTMRKILMLYASLGESARWELLQWIDEERNEKEGQQPDGDYRMPEFVTKHGFFDAYIKGQKYD